MNSTKSTYISLEEAKQKLEQFCVYQERCHTEVIDKMHKLKVNSALHDSVIVHLIKNNFLNEERFACSFSRGKHKFKGWGKQRIEQELKFRHISSYNIKTALKEIEIDYLKNFYSLAQKKWETITDTIPQKKKNKWIGYLMRKGYESHLIFDFLKDLENQEKQTE